MKTFCCLIIATCVSALGLAVDASAYTVSINQFVEHPSLNESVRGFKEQLAELGAEVNYHEHNAQADMPTVTQIVNQIIDEKPDLVLAVATPSAQITAQRIKDVPILFTAVTDPVDARLVASMTKPGANVSGTTDLNPVAAQLALIKEIQPVAKNIGIIYNAGESNSVVQVELARRAAAANGLELVEAVTADTAGVMAAAQSLIGKVDAIYLPTDNTVISSVEAVIKVSLDHKIPIYPAEDDSLRKGGVAVLSISYYQLGRQTGRMAAKILVDGADPGQLTVEEQSDFNLIVNRAFADKIGLEIPETVLSKANETISN
ncbi:MAG: ABC transporter substrate-binding protein [Deltaproteobacteria bacterium]|jgi:putative ABC transport system substrate-binding protein|nr:ABC transporter substrate-binding protein [Deltaproteobacteria bacterium]